METVQQITIEAKSLNIFFLLYKHNSFKGQRLGQAFFNHFDLYKMKRYDQLERLYQEENEEKAKQLIRELVIQH